jgi:hypothetical protein
MSDPAGRVALALRPAQAELSTAGISLTASASAQRAQFTADEFNFPCATCPAGGARALLARLLLVDPDLLIWMSHQPSIAAVEWLEDTHPLRGR